jgi:hypothetical protein
MTRIIEFVSQQFQGIAGRSNIERPTSNNVFCQFKIKTEHSDSIYPIKLTVSADSDWVEQRTAEYRISKGGIATLYQFIIDRIP